MYIAYYNAGVVVVYSKVAGLPPGNVITTISVL
jgi:hypothetical protein